ncbi:hypothetical protein SCLCIDRAFT_1222236 [Scleroderma citrinum Foug A]|uniref:Uncharacterized protein n=1 Tax=Scleroderma citrinum Foug A TaxID=1036808 RepID=A0A0C2ZNK9_9AGAM|nr:hypothetical protein SCLCIDRAFT_1222236 [Scleroderma citrinum Foug A]
MDGQLQVCALNGSGYNQIVKMKSTSQEEHVESSAVLLAITSRAHLVYTLSYDATRAM